MDLNDCRKKVAKLVADEEVRKIVFNNRFDSPEFLTTTEEINRYFSNILNLTFALLYSKFRKWKESPDIDVKTDDTEKFNSYMRVNKTFTELYTEKNVTFSTIEPTIMDAQLDMHYHGVLWQNLNLTEILNQDTNNRFAYFVQKAKIARTSSRGLQGKENLASKYEELIEYLKLFPYLRTLNVEYTPFGENFGDIYAVAEIPDTDTAPTAENPLPTKLEKIPFPYINRVKFVDDLTDEELITYLTLINVGDEYYFLEEVIFDKTGPEKKEIAYLNYSKLGSENNYLRVNVTCDENYTARAGEYIAVSPKAFRTVIKILRINSVKENKNKIIIKDFYAINYRYVKQLTMSVADILTAENKKTFTSAYRCKYPELFNHVWDTIIAILIVKESATSILRLLFSKDDKAYSQLLFNLQMRFGSNVFDAEKLEAETKKEAASSFNRWVEHYFGDNHTPNDVSNKVIENQRVSINSEVRALKLIEYLSELLKINETCGDKYKNKYPLNINSHIQMLEWLTRADLPNERKKERATSIVLNTLKSLYVFYCGFFRYVEIKNDFRERSNLFIFTGDEIDEFQKNANAAFRREVATQLKRLSGLGTGLDAVVKMLGEIKELNDECLFVKGRNSKNAILKNFLGRYQLLDFNMIRPLSELLKFEGAEDKSQIDEVINKIITVYGYLQNGSDPESGMDGIYPYVGTYEYMHETRDGYRIAHFSISSPVRDADMDVEILSEFRYGINSKYYCLPNKMCGNNEIKLWIEPTVIDYKNFVMVDEDE